MAESHKIRIWGAREHNLRGINVDIPRGRWTVITGPSGSGKTSLAFDTIHAEGQRRYVESLSIQARKVLEQLPRPDVDRVEGLIPTIALEQRHAPPNPRTTVASATEIYDYLRVLFARLGTPICPRCQSRISKTTSSEIVDDLVALPAGTKLHILAPMITQGRGRCLELFSRLTREGFARARVNRIVVPLDPPPDLPQDRSCDIDAVVDRIILKPDVNARLAESVETALRIGGGRVIATIAGPDGTELERFYSAVFACPSHPDVRLEELSPSLFSFHSPSGACQKCQGLGIHSEFDEESAAPDPNLSLGGHAIAAWRGRSGTLGRRYAKLIEEFGERFSTPLTIPLKELSPEARRILMHGTDQHDAAQYGAAFEGVLPNLRRRWAQTGSEAGLLRLRAFLKAATCPSCVGTRLTPQALWVQVQGLTIAQVTGMTVDQCAEYFRTLSFSEGAAPVGEPLRTAILHRLEFQRQAGLGYLQLNRLAATLSGGEWQRIRLANQIGGGLSGVCYILDEPTIGLHPRDNRRLCDILRNLCDTGSTVVVVEHDEALIRASDHMIEIGPGAGENGGQVLASGPTADVLAKSTSPTAAHLREQRSASFPSKGRAPDPKRRLTVTGATANNLRNITVSFPLGLFVCITGVSGSGKSTLVFDVLLESLRRALRGVPPRLEDCSELRGAEAVAGVVQIDQLPIGRSQRSNAATFVGAMEPIRDLFAETREARVRGYGPTRFSFNVRGGRCEHCEGKGARRVTMHFLPDVFVPCEHCHGARYNRETLDVRFRGKSIADVLAMRIAEGLAFFDAFPRIREKLQVLVDVGLGYAPLGQPSTSLSGGEAQRIKLAAELHRPAVGHTLYLLDEPTTGLHFGDIDNLIQILQRIVERGNTVVVVEHNLQMVRSADWIIDLGPEAGDGGGLVVAEGTPQAIAKAPDSRTGFFLR